MIELRPYQREAVDSVYRYFTKHQGFPLIVLPTGTGKSLVLSEFARSAIDNYPDTRILILTHVRELIQQNYLALISIWPEAPAGIYSAGLGRRDMHSQIVFAGIQSVHNKIKQFGRIDLVIVDEAHLIPRNASTMYGKVLTSLALRNPSMKVIGLTATHYRLDSGMLHEGKDAIFDDVCYEADIADMIEQGYLCEVRPKQTKTTLDVSGVHKRGGEFIAGELEAAVNIDEITQNAVDEIAALGSDRGSWLIFCAGVAHARAVAEAIRGHNISCETVVGDTPPPERDRIIRDFKSGHIRALTNANVLTTGFDAPGVDLIAGLRPTNSTGLYVQMVGRGTRLAEGKEDCLYLDFAGNAARHGPLDSLTIKSKEAGDGEGECPVKVCPDCAEIVHAAVKECPQCGHKFPPPEIKITRTAATDAILTKQIQSSWHDVDNVVYARHEKRDGKGTPSLRVEYQCGISRYSEWVCFQHSGFARQKACRWWTQRMPEYPAPTDIDEALRASDYIPSPARICIKPDGKYTRIVSVEF